jgi:hypothetical protein
MCSRYFARQFFVILWISTVTIERNVAYSEESSFDERRVPRRSAPSFMNAKNTGTRISTWMVEVIMPPTMGLQSASSHRSQRRIPRE